MADIFLSYASEDRERVRPLVQRLEEHGWSVWWDRKISPGKTWPQMIQEGLDNTRTMIVVWSEESIQSEWVTIETSEGKKRGPLIPVRIDAVEPPLQFRLIHAADLSQWENSTTHPEFQAVIGELEKAIGVRDTAAQHSESLPTPTTSMDVRAEIDRSASSFSVESEAERNPEQEREANKTAQAKPKAEEPKTRRTVAPETRSGVTERDRVIGAFFGAVIGIAIGVFALLLVGEDWYIALIPGASGGIAGAISGTNPRIIALAAISAFTGWIVVSFSLSAESTTSVSLSDGAIIGAPVGMVVGAILGIVLKKWGG